MKITILSKSVTLALLVFNAGVFAADISPYNYEKSGNALFKATLDEVKLVLPNGSMRLSNAKPPNLSFDGYVTRNFRVPSGKNYIQMSHVGVSPSSTELRHLTTFSRADSNRMQGVIMVASASSGLDNVTLLQVHNESAPTDAPLMRIAQVVENGVTFYEAKLRLSVCNKNACEDKYDTYRWLDSNGDVTVDTHKNRSFYVRVKNGTVKMKMGGKRGTLMCKGSYQYSASNCNNDEKSHTDKRGDHVIDKSWSESGFYFKTGIYIQKPGTVVIRYKSLAFDVAGA